MDLRPYQQEAVASVYRYLREYDNNPCIVIPTAGGKTPLLATICKDAVTRWNGRVLVLAHVKELLAQAADKLSAVCPDVSIGIYSAGLGSRDTLTPVIVAGIQSAYRRARELGRFDLVIIDEAHLIPPDGDGMYRTLLTALKSINPQLRIIGLTATPFRMTTGPICGPDNVLNAICYEIGVRELIVQGYLCPLVSKAGIAKTDFNGLHVRGGEFVSGEVEALMDETRLVESACREIIAYTKDRRSCLIFASGVQHGQHIVEKFLELGQTAEGVFGNTLDYERERTLADFKDGRLKYLVNVNILTTGFDAPRTDCVALLRPTLSPGLYYQQVGRGFRLHPAKQNCLVLDFGGNVLRHGPVDALRLRASGESASGPAPAKECPCCHSVIAAGYMQCPDCGFEFERASSSHEARAASEGILTGQASEVRYLVREVRYSVHAKRNAPPDAPRSMRVEYRIGFNQWQSEWICFEHSGFAKQKAEHWWRRRTCEPVPETAAEAVELAEAGVLAKPASITVRSVAGEQFARIVQYDLQAIREPEPDYVAADDSIPF